MLETFLFVTIYVKLNLQDAQWVLSLNYFNKMSLEVAVNVTAANVLMVC